MLHKVTCHTAYIQSEHERTDRQHIDTQKSFGNNHGNGAHRTLTYNQIRDPFDL